MTHERLRRFNTRDTYPEQRLDNDLCQVVKARGTLVFVRGQVGQDLATSASVAPGDPAGQAEQAMRNLQELLAEAGAGLDDICKVTIYLTDPRHREPVYYTVGRWLKGVFPVSTGRTARPAQAGHRAEVVSRLTSLTGGDREGWRTRRRLR